MYSLPHYCYKHNPGALVDENDNKSLLFKPITIKNYKIKNRIFVAPMDQFVADNDGKPNSFHYIHYGNLALRGAGLIIVEATAVQKIGRISACDLGIWNDEQANLFKPITEYIRFQGAIPAIQLAHSGRKGSGVCDSLKLNRVATAEEHGWPDEIIAPSAIAYDDKWSVPNALTKEQIKEVVKAFGDAARRADEAGFECVQIHAAHGYLIHEFLSPITNKRTDEYGGSFENRIRLCLEVIEAVKAQWPAEKLLFIRFSCDDYVENGWNVQETAKLCSIIKNMGIDFVDCSSGGLSADQVLPKLDPGYQVPFAREIKKQNPDLNVSAVGLIYNGKQAEEILQSGAADALCVGRPFLRDSSTVLNWADDINVEIQWPRQYNRGRLIKK